MRIGYLTSKYPAASHTFILREAQALRARGLELATFSIRRARDGDLLGSEAQEEALRTRWLLPVRLTQMLPALFWSLRTRLSLTCRTLLTAVSQRGLAVGQRFKWLCYFIEAVLLAHWLEREGFDHLHCHFGNSGSSTGMLAARLARVPFSVTCHGSELLEPQTFSLAAKVVQAAFVVCVSEHGRARLSAVSPPEHWHKIHVVRCGVPAVETYPDHLGSSPAAILCVARLSPEKGHMVLLDALDKLRYQGIDFRCILVGDGPMRPLIERRARELHLGAALTFTGSLPPRRVAEFYKSADVVVISSFREGIPVVLMEAMAHGRTVVATRVGGVPELVEHGTRGLVVEPGDSAQLAEALRQVLADHRLARRFAENAKRFVRQEYNLDRSADRLTQLFKRTLASCSSGNVRESSGPTSCA